MDALRTSGMIEAATLATGISFRADEDLMIARTRRWSDIEDGPDRIQTLSFHHDVNNTKDQSRVATFMVYLTTVDASAGHGGETFFPALNADIKTDSIAQGLLQKYDVGERILAENSALGTACEERLLRWRSTGGGSDDAYAGVGARCETGTALVFAACGENASFGSWHAPCKIKGPEEKWIVTFFKSPAPCVGGMMRGL